MFTNKAYSAAMTTARRIANADLDAAAAGIARTTTTTDERTVRDEAINKIKEL